MLPAEPTTHQPVIGHFLTLPVDNDVINAESEMSLYQNTFSTTKPENVLEYWKQHEKTLPNLAKLARKYHSVPPSTVCAESGFSEMGFLINDRRTHLGTDTISNLALTRTLLRIDQNL